MQCSLQLLLLLAAALEAQGLLHGPAFFLRQQATRVAGVLHGVNPTSSSASEKRDIGRKAAIALGSVVSLSGAALGGQPSVATATAAPASAGLSVAPLPYAFSALEPWIDARTNEVHHDKHYASYVAKTNTLTKGSKLEAMSVTQIMAEAWKSKDQQVLYNNAAQVYNHEFYWEGMTPTGGGEPAPSSKIAIALNKKYGDFAGFRKAFVAAGLSQFGSGWAWLVYDKKTKDIDIVKSTGADNPINTSEGRQVPLLTMDVWEHAYYLKYQNKRNEYVDAFLDHLVSWQIVEDRLSKV